MRSDFDRIGGSIIGSGHEQLAILAAEMIADAKWSLVGEHPTTVYYLWHALTPQGPFNRAVREFRQARHRLERSFLRWNEVLCSTAEGRSRFNELQDQRKIVWLALNEPPTFELCHQYYDEPTRMPPKVGLRRSFRRYLELCPWYQPYDADVYALSVRGQYHGKIIRPPWTQSGGV